MIFLFFLLYSNTLLWKHTVIASICNYSDNGDPICCSGFIKNVYGDCVKSECDYDCGYGRCVGLNVCECHDKSIRSETCPLSNQKLCTNNCSNKGQCLNGKCICESGYFGEDCNKNMISTCYVKINRGLCKSTPENLQLTKEECCSMFQVAWGNPCVFCDRNHCPKGYIRKNNQCEDIDECQFKSICLNGECINEKGSFRCQCPPDYTLDESTMSCQYQTDQCQLYGSACGFYGKCVTTVDGQYKCLCRKPYTTSSNGKSCVKNSIYNVCKFFAKLCQPYGECQPSGLTYFCNCSPGFHQSEDRKSCIVNSNSDVCQSPEVSDRCRGGQCVPEGKGYKCICYGEYQSSDNDQECIRYAKTEPNSQKYCSRWEYYSLCEGGECIEINNDYYCKCNNGFHSTENGRRCLKKEVISSICATNQHYCQGGGCIKLGDNNYECQCVKGFIKSQDGKSCIKTGRTGNNSLICDQYRHRCLTGICYQINSNDYMCLCMEGYQQAADKRSCVKKQPNINCQNPEIAEKCRGGQCINEGNGYRCLCYGRYVSYNNDQECVRFITTEPVLTRHCSKYEYYSLCQGGECVDLKNNYYCKCTNGFYATDNGRKCEKNQQPNINCQNPEIAEKCRGGQCINEENGYRCLCYGKYVSYNNDQECVRFKTTEPVLTRYCSKYEYSSLCQGGECVDLNNNYYCKCTNEFYATDNGRKCERKATTEPVTEEPDNSYCLLPEYSTRCKGGQCIGDRTYGFKCLCLAGFTATSDGRSCEPEYVNPCLSNGNKCQYGRCQRNGVNDYQCVCPPYTSKSADGRSCLINYKTTESTLNYCDNLENRLRCGTGVCDNDKCICETGYKISEDGKECYKIEKVSSICSLNQLKCEGGGCMELDDQNYRCQCLTGYISTENGRRCMKSERTLTNKSKCDIYRSKCMTGICYPIGSYDYRCLCVGDYILADDKRSCIEVEKPKCSKNQHRCKGGHCFDIVSGYLCICNDDHYVTDDGRDCLMKRIMLKSVKINKNYLFSLSMNSCDKKDVIEKCQPGKCVEKSNGYQCICPHSFKANHYERECIRDSNKCPYCFYGCLDENNVSVCSCPEKYDHLYDTGLCVVKSKTVSHSLGYSSCSSKSLNKTLVIRFSGISKHPTENPTDFYQNVSKLLLIKQQKSVRLNYCVPIRKRQKIMKSNQKQILTPVVLWEIICTFNCQ